MPLDRRAVLGAGLAATAATVAGCAGAERTPVWSVPAAEISPATTAPGTTGATGSPTTAVPAPAGDVQPPGAAAVAQTSSAIKILLTKYLTPTSDNPRHPGYAGAVALLMVDGKTMVHTAVGNALRYKAGPVELPASKRVAMRTDSIFDLASLTKVYTALLVLRLVDQGKVDLDAPLQDYLPEFTGTGKGAVTIAMLLAHTSALPVGAKVTGMADNTARWKSVLATPLTKGQKPGSTFRYSSVGLMVLGRLVEKLTGTSLDKAIRDNLTTPLGLTDTGFRPLNWVRDKERLVATDARTSRGLLRGTVHDDVANILGGVAGHAGIFATAADVAVIGQLMLNGGTYLGRRILSADIVKKALTNMNAGKPAIDPDRPHRTATHGLGFELDQSWFMGRLATTRTFGHTGFTGTSIWVDPETKTFVLFLSNRVHPNWSWSNPDVHRVALANAVAARL